MIDRDHLAKMFDGDYAIADKFIAAFTERIQIQIPLLKQYLDNKEYSSLSNTAHIIKTQSGYMNLEEISKMAQILERHAAEGAYYDEMISLVNQITEKLSEVLSSLKS